MLIGKSLAMVGEARYVCDKHSVDYMTTYAEHWRRDVELRDPPRTNPPLWAIFGVIGTPFFVLAIVLLLQRCAGHP
jgi:hypothetical protein